MRHHRPVTEVGLRELRRNASEPVRRAEAGEQLTVTVSGRPAPVLGPVSDRAWRRWTDLAPLFEGPTDPRSGSDRDLLDGAAPDPWSRR